MCNKFMFRPLERGAGLSIKLKLFWTCPKLINLNIIPKLAVKNVLQIEWTINLCTREFSPLQSVTHVWSVLMKHSCRLMTVNYWNSSKNKNFINAIRIHARMFYLFLYSWYASNYHNIYKYHAVIDWIFMHINEFF